MEHIFIMLPLFALVAYQDPTGNDRLGLPAPGSEFRVQGSGFRVQEARTRNSEPGTPNPEVKAMNQDEYACSVF